MIILTFVFFTGYYPELCTREPLYINDCCIFLHLLIGIPITFVARRDEPILLFSDLFFFLAILFCGLLRSIFCSKL